MKQLQVMALALIIVGTGAMFSCSRDEGPMEKAGKEVDQAASKAGDKVERAGDTIRDAARGDK